MRSSFASRIRVIAGLIIFVAIVLFVRLYFVQVVDGDKYRLKAENQYVSQSTNQIDRGNILFTARDGSYISAATLASGYTVVINPSILESSQIAYDQVKAVLPTIDAGTFLEKAGKKDDTHEELATRVSEENGKQISDADIKGLDVLRERWRFYPGNDLASHTIGFLGYGDDGVTLNGQYGLERFYNEALTRSDGGLYVNFFADLFTNIRSQFLSGDVRPGADLVTSIEPTVQQFLEGELARYGVAWNPRTSGAIVMDPKTGAIIAMAARPTFNLNDFKEADPKSFSNPLVENVYEFGSTMKPLTIAAAIDAGAITPKTTYNDKGFAVYDGSRISNFDGKGRGVVSMQEVLSQSLNTGVAFAVEQMGTDTFRSYFEKFGLTEETGIDLPNEGSPLTQNLQSPRTIEYVTASFGQGLAVTPIAMARALGTLANHGMVPGPHVGVELRYGGGLNKTLGWTPERRAISEESSEAVTRMLVEVVDTALQHGAVKIPEYSVAAKTGTAQIARPDARGYYADRYLHSFFGYFPAYDPQFIVFFYAVEPKGAQYASETWTKPFIETTKFLLSYYDVPPDRAPKE